jgi:hypothetical protein
MSNFLVLKAAFEEGRKLIESGNGFTLRVRTNSGDTFEGIPPSDKPITAPVDGLLTLEMGSDFVAIPSRSIESITVIAVA